MNCSLYLMLNQNESFSWKWKKTQKLHNKWNTVLLWDISSDRSSDLLLMCIYDNVFLEVQSSASVAASCPVLLDNQVFYSASKNRITSHFSHAKFQIQVYLFFKWSFWGQKCSFHFFSQFRSSKAFHLLKIQNTFPTLLML